MYQNPGDYLEKWLEDPSFRNWALNRDAADYQQWETWLFQHPEYRELADTTAQIIKGVRFQDIPVDNEENKAALEKLWRRLEAPAHTTPVIPIARKRIGLRIAATIALLLFAGAFLYYQLAIRPFVVVQTDFGEKQEITLPDQTIVTLNANSSIKYKKENPRQVWLTGEAFFKVEKKPATNAKFLVLTNDLTVEVLGTVFNVNSREERTEVFLEEGKVKLNLKDEKKSDVMLEPGDVLTYSARQAGNYKKEHGETETHTSWKNGVLVLKETSLQDVILKMEEIYGVDITLQTDSLKGHQMTVAIPIDNLNIALSTIESTLGLQIRQQSTREYKIE